MLVQSTSGSAADPEWSQELAVKPLFPRPPWLKAEALVARELKPCRLRREDSGAASGGSVDVSQSKVTKKADKENGEELPC